MHACALSATRECSLSPAARPDSPFPSLPLSFYLSLSLCHPTALPPSLPPSGPLYTRTSRTEILSLFFRILLRRSDPYVVLFSVLVLARSSKTPADRRLLSETGTRTRSIRTSAATWHLRRQTISFSSPPPPPKIRFTLREKSYNRSWTLLEDLRNSGLLTSFI